MGTIFIKNKKCPFCNNLLENSRVICPNKKYIPLLECKECKAYFYKEYWYHKLECIAKEYHRKLNRDVYKYMEIQQTPKKNHKNHTKKKKKVSVHKKSSYVQETGTIDSLPRKTISVKYKVQTDINKSCRYFKNNCCIYSNDDCKPDSIRCKYISNQIVSQNKKSVNNDYSSPSKEHKREHFVTAIVIIYNRKCIFNNHKLESVTGICNIATKNEIKQTKFPVLYCVDCDKYYIFKTDFDNLKSKGVLLCQVDDYTKQIENSNTRANMGNESVIHSLGYNVTKQDGYTTKQRKYILANIIENYNISQSVIISIIDMNIARHGSQKNYSVAVGKWQEDREFVSGYKHGDLPDVIVEKMVLRYNQ